MLFLTGFGNYSTLGFQKSSVGLSLSGRLIFRKTKPSEGFNPNGVAIVQRNDPETRHKT